MYKNSALRKIIIYKLDLYRIRVPLAWIEIIFLSLSTTKWGVTLGFFLWLKKRRGERVCWSEKLSRVGKLISNSIRETEKSGMIEKGTSL